MSRRLKWLYLIIGGVGALALAVAGLFVFTKTAAAVTDPASQAAAGDGYARVAPLSRGTSGMDVYWPGDGEPPLGDYDQALADALGISVEELRAAYETARATAIQQAVDEGLITQEQADELLNGSAPGPRGFRGWHGASIDMNALLADALGISVEALQAAQEEAHAAMIAQAVEAGTITQEEADLMAARVAIRDYLQEAMATAYKDAVQRALSDGVITQAQADQLLSSDGLGPGGFGWFPSGRGMHGGGRAFAP